MIYGELGEYKEEYEVLSGKKKHVVFMKVILSGGAGFVGRNLIRVMINEGFEPENITVIDKNEKNMVFLEKYRVKKIMADLAENGEWMNTFEGADYIINLAAQISSPKKHMVFNRFRKEIPVFSDSRSW